MPKKGNSEFLFVGFGVDTADGSVSNRGLIFRESGYDFSGIMNDVHLNGWSYVKDGVFDFTLSTNQKHTLGVREKYGRYYPAVDGEILMPSTFDDEMQSVYDDFSNYVKMSNGEVRFVIADFSGSCNTIADVKIVSTSEEPSVTLDKDTFIQHRGYDVGEREVVYKQDDGAYCISAENNGSFLSYSTYDLKNTALSFKFAQISASAGLHLSITCLLYTSCRKISAGILGNESLKYGVNSANSFILFTGAENLPISLRLNSKILPSFDGRRIIGFSESAASCFVRQKSLYDGRTASPLLCAFLKSLTIHSGFFSASVLAFLSPSVKAFDFSISAFTVYTLSEAGLLICFVTLP